MTRSHAQSIQERLKRRSFGCAVVLALVALWAPVSASAEPIPLRVQLKWLHQYQFAGFYAAQMRGYYAEAGFDVELLPGDATRSSVDVVVAGDAEFGVGTAELLLQAARGAPIRILAPIFQHSPLVLVAMASDTLQHVHDLSGQTIMMEADSAELYAYLRDEGIDLDGLTIVPHTHDVGALLRGEVAAMSAYVTDEVFALRQVADDVLIFSPRSAGIDFYGDTLFGCADFVERYPEATQAFVGATLRGWAWALEHPDEIVDHIRGIAPERHSREHLHFEAARTYELIAPHRVEIGHNNPGRWSFIERTFASLGMLEGEVDLDSILWRSARVERRVHPLSWVVLVLSFLLGVMTTAFVMLARRSRGRIVAARRVSRKAEEAAREAREEALFLIENMTDLVWTTNAEHRLQWVSPSVAQGVGSTVEALSGGSLFDLFEPASAERLQSAVAARVAEPRAPDESESLDLTLELAWRVEHHTDRWVEAHVRVFLDREGAIRSIQGVGRDVSERRSREAELRELASIDPLTGVANRRSLMEALEKLPERGGGLMFFDLDHFKALNDAHGHPAGDHVLRVVCHLVGRALPPRSVIGRVGGEEFAILLPERSPQECEALAERLVHLVGTTPAQFEEVSLSTTISLGLTHVAPGEPWEDAWSRVDALLYKAKTAGRNRVVSDSV